VRSPCQTASTGPLTIASSLELLGELRAIYKSCGGREKRSVCVLVAGAGVAVVGDIVGH